MNTLKPIALICAISLCGGCASMGLKHKPRSAGGMASIAQDKDSGAPDRMLIWKAYLTIEVWDVSNSVSEAIGMAKHDGGYVEQQSGDGVESASIRIRIPQAAFTNVISSIESLGTIKYQNVEGEDVTEQYIDVEARLKNMIALRDRLRELLAKAVDVKDILAVETELTRIQSDIDSMEGKIKLLKGQVDYATIELSLERKQILGPLGYLFKGVWWTIGKLFVIRD